MQKIKFQFRALESCPLCNQTFEKIVQKFPRILKCGHSVCSNCVIKSVNQNGFLTCPTCGQQFSKKECSNLKVNQFYLDMMENIQANFGKFFVFDQMKTSQNYQNQVNISIRKKNNSIKHYQRENQMSQQFVKCKNSPCLRRTDLIFCSDDCQIQFEEVQTKRDQILGPDLLKDVQI